MNTTCHLDNIRDAMHEKTSILLKSTSPLVTHWLDNYKDIYFIFILQIKSKHANKIPLGAVDAFVYIMKT